MKRFFSKEILGLLFFSLFVFGLNLWGYPLFDVDEPRYAETAREMLSSGDWITPHFNGMVRFDKPAMFYWLIAGSYKLFGLSAFSARLVSAVMATFTLLLLYILARRYLNARAGLYAALIFGTMLEVFAIARWSITDMTLTAFMTATWLSLFLALVRDPKWYLVAGIAGAFGVLTKGPVAIALPGLTFLILLFTGFRDQLKRLISPWPVLGLAVFLLLSLPWYVLVAKANPNAFMGSFFIFHNVERFTSTVSGHHGPWYYYIPVILLGGFPWTLFLPALINEYRQSKSDRPALIRYAHIWFWVVFLFFSVAGTKLLTYVLPAFPALAILLGWTIERATSDTHVEATQDKFPRLAGPLLGVGLLFGGLLLLSLWSPYAGIPKPLENLYAPLKTQILLGLLMLTFAGSAFIWIRSRLSPKGFAFLASGMTITLLYANIMILPEAATLFQGDTMAFAAQASQNHLPIATFGMKKPSLVFYTRHQVYYLPGDPGAIAANVIEPVLYVMIKNKDIADFRKGHPLAKLIQSGLVYSLFETFNQPLAKEMNQ